MNAAEEVAEGELVLGRWVADGEVLGDRAEGRWSRGIGGLDCNTIVVVVETGSTVGDIPPPIHYRPAPDNREYGRRGENEVRYWSSAKNRGQVFMRKKRGSGRLLGIHRLDGKYSLLRK
jgi:hypothetical protein